MIKHKQNITSIFMLNLLYPAVLGSMLYSFFDTIAKFTFTYYNIMALLMLLAVLIFYSIDYIYTSVNERYGVIELVADFILLGLMYAAFNCIRFGENQCNIKNYSFYMCMTFVIFIIWDISRLDGLGDRFPRILKFETFLFIIYIPPIAFNLGITYSGVSAVIAAIGMLYIFVDFYNHYNEKLNV